MREYSVDPLEATFVRDVMETDVFTVEPARRSPISTGHSAKAHPSGASGCIRFSTPTGNLSGSFPGLQCLLLKWVTE